MHDDPASAVTTLLEEIRAGNAEAGRRLVECIYRDLHRVAEGLMAPEPAGHTLQPTALLHEALARLFRADAFRQAPNRAYLFGAAARAMRQVLVEHARRRTARRGGARTRVPLDDVLLYFAERDLDVEALHEALDRLAALNERQSHVVTLRFFGGFTVPEVAEQLGVSTFTVENDFRLARAWLRQQLREAVSPRPES